MCLHAGNDTQSNTPIEMPTYMHAYIRTLPYTCISACYGQNAYTRQLTEALNGTPLT